MKYPLVTAIALVASVFIPIDVRGDPSEPRKHALLIGVSDYTGDWKPLNSKWDVEALADLLKSKFGFHDDDIVTLTAKSQTTRKAILDGIKNLINETNEGDVVFLQYSGHGYQIPDDNRDEIDGLDETLVPSDCTTDEKDDPHEIRDDVIADLLDQLRAKKPANVTLSFDCCRAGSNTRGPHSAIRGKAWKGPVPVAPAGVQKTDSVSGLFKKDEMRVSDNVFVLAAARQDRNAYETTSMPFMGKFTAALVKVLSESSDRTTYRDVADQLRELLLQEGQNQVPQIEGNLDHILFSEKIERAPSGSIPVAVTADGRLQLQAGVIHGITVGSQFDLYPAGTRERDFKNGTPLVKTEVASVDSVNAELKLMPKYAKLPTIRKLSGARAVEIVHQYGDNTLRVGFDQIEKLADAAEFIKEVKALPLVVATSAKTAPDVEFVPAPGAGPARDNEPKQIFLRRGQDASVLTHFTLSSAAGNDVRHALERESRLRTLRKLNAPNSSVRVDLRVRSAEVEIDSATGKPRRDLCGGEKWLSDDNLAEMEGGVRRAKVGDRIVVQVRNSGSIRAWFTILDLRPDGVVGPIWPHPNHEGSQENVLEPDGKWHTISCRGQPAVFQIDEPVGIESFKVIATTKPTNFAPLLDAETLRARGPSEKVPNDPLSQLLASATAGTRASRTTLTQGDWSTQTLTFEIVTSE